MCLITMAVADFVICVSLFLSVLVHIILVRGYKRECDEKSLLSHPMYIWQGAVLLSRGS